MNVLVCGKGNIGKHVVEELDCNAEINIHTCDKGDMWPQNNHYDFTIICVPTEDKGNGEVDLTEVYDCFDRFAEVTDLFIIRSAVPVGTGDDLYLKYNVPVVVSPEFWGTTKNCPEPDTMILGGYSDFTNRVAEFYNKVKNGYFHYVFTDYKTAELTKYMENCWIATKVTFCNEFAKIASKFGVNYNELRECWLADKRVSPSHTLVYSDKPYYDSHCLNKDIPALLWMCKDMNVPLMTSVDKINKEAKNCQQG